MEASQEREENSEVSKFQQKPLTSSAEKKKEEKVPVSAGSKSIKLRKVKFSAKPGTTAAKLAVQLASLEGIDVHDVFSGPLEADSRPLFTCLVKCTWSKKQKEANLAKLGLKERTVLDPIEKCTLFVHKVPAVVSAMDDETFDQLAEHWFEYDVRRIERFTSNGQTKVVVITECIEDCVDILNEKSINLCGFTVPRNRYSRKRLKGLVVQCFNCYGLRHRASECRRRSICHRCGLERHSGSDDAEPSCGKVVPFCVLCKVYGHSAVQYSCPVKKQPGPTKAERLQSSQNTASHQTAVSKPVEKPKWQDAPIPCTNAWQKRKEKLAPPPVMCNATPSIEKSTIQSTRSKEELESLCVKLAAAAVHLAKEHSVSYGEMYNELLILNGEIPCVFPVMKVLEGAKRVAEMAFTPAIDDVEKRFCYNRSVSLLSIPEKCNESVKVVGGDVDSSSTCSTKSTMTDFEEEVTEKSNLLTFAKSEEKVKKSKRQATSAEKVQVFPNLLRSEQIEERETAIEVPEVPATVNSKKAEAPKMLYTYKVDIVGCTLPVSQMTKQQKKKHIQRTRSMFRSAYIKYENTEADRIAVTKELKEMDEDDDMPSYKWMRDDGSNISKIEPLEAIVCDE